MDYLYIILGILIIPIAAQIYISAVYAKSKKIRIKKSLSGFETARCILDSNKLNDIHIVETEGNLSDHYDPRRKVVRLSHDIFQGESVAAMAVSAHEVGHALQDKNKYFLMKVRSVIFPVVHFSSKIAYLVIFIGFLTEVMDLINLGIMLVGIGVLFQLITLPVEFNASKQAEEEINKLGIATKEEKRQIHTMLRAAALTYVAGLLASLLELLRLVMISRNRD